MEQDYATPKQLLDDLDIKYENIGITNDEVLYRGKIKGLDAQVSLHYGRGMHNSELYCKVLIKRYSKTARGTDYETTHLGKGNVNGNNWTVSEVDNRVWYKYLNK